MKAREKMYRQLLAQNTVELSISIYLEDDDFVVPLDEALNL